MNATENSANPVIEKANKIHHEGVDAINEGRAPLFTWPEDLGLRYNASMYFDWSCGDALFEPVLIPILVAMEKNQVSLINVGIHFQTHSTLCEAKHPENVPPAPFSFTPSTSLVGHVIEFSEFVIGHNTLLMAASDIPPEIMDARTELESLYLEMGLVPMPIQNLLHVSLARIVGGCPEDVKRFASSLLVLRDNLHREPIRLKVLEVRTGSAIDLLRPVYVP